MAKGNNGNVLQHGLLCSIGGRLPGVANRLSLIDTHAMGYRERLHEEPSPENTHTIRFARARDLVWSAAVPAEHPTITAWRRTLDDARSRLYPNSIALLKEMDIQVAGLACEVEREKANSIVTYGGIELRRDLRVHFGDWRGALAGGHFRALNDRGAWQDVEIPAFPWLVTMDPMCYMRNSRDPTHINQSDLMGIVGPVLAALVASGRPGCFALFSYGQTTNAAELDADVATLATQTGLTHAGVRGTFHDRAALAFTPSASQSVIEAIREFTEFFDNLP